MIYKVSYVDDTGTYPGGIKNETKAPEVGDRIKIGPHHFKVIALHEIMPPRGEFLYLHASIHIDEIVEDE